MAIRVSGCAPGFTLVEILVALTLVGVGIAAWVGTGAIALRLAGVAERESGAVRSARATAERIAARRCASPAAGEDGDSRWRVEHRSNGIALIRAEHAFQDEHDTASAVSELAARCP